MHHAHLQWHGDFLPGMSTWHVYMAFDKSF